MRPTLITLVVVALLGLSAGSAAAQPAGAG